MPKTDLVADHINRSEIKRRRLARKLSRKRAGMLGGFSGDYVAQQWKQIECETHDIRSSTLIRVAKALGCGINDLVNGG